MRKIKKDTTLTVGLPTALMLFVALMLTLSAQDVYAWGQFGAAGEFCKTCHTAFSGGAGVAQHDAHASAANYNCTVCHSTASATSIYASPFTSDCTQCHLPQGLRQHHRNAAVHQCFGCHPVPETAAPENTMPPAYAGTGLNPCDGTEELFASFTVGLDNDGDLLYDVDDPDCQAQIEADCTDGIDNDGDGFIDCDDQDCSDQPNCLTNQMEADCADGIDNDGDGFIDCTDTDCFTDPGCQNPTVENCTDGIDNDGDGFTDCADQDCSTDSTCQVTQAENCTDGIDNDGDGFIDCADQDCAADPVCLNTGTNHLTTTCLACHQDRSAITSCSTGTNHVARVGQQAWDETLVELGLNCNATGGGTGGGTTGGGVPADHTDNERDYMHRPGKDMPYTNGCTSCHGSDLTGDIGPSCFSCHGKEWNESAPSGGGTTGGGVPADHTDNEHDYMHRPGKDMPYTNGCTSCHGSDLTGDIGPSCFSCHGKEWNESAPSSGDIYDGHDSYDSDHVSDDEHDSYYRSYDRDHDD